MDHTVLGEGRLESRPASRPCSLPHTLVGGDDRFASSVNTGTICSVNAPSSWAAAARSWDSAEYSSSRVREKPPLLAIISADRPWLKEKSSYRASTFGPYGMPVARAEPSGTRLMTSTPPATTTSCWPDITACTAKSSACWLEPQAPVDGGPGNAFRPTGGQHRIAADVAGLVADLGDAAPHHVVDDLGTDAGAFHELVEDDRGQVGGMHAGKGAVALPDRGADRLDDDCFPDCFTHISTPILTPNCPIIAQRVLRTKKIAKNSP